MMGVVIFTADANQTERKMLMDDIMKYSFITGTVVKMVNFSAFIKIFKIMQEVNKIHNTASVLMYI